MIRFYHLFPISIALALPLVAAAQTAFDDFIGTVSRGLNTIIIFFFLVATVIFLWGIVRYIAAGGDETKVAEARNLIIWGIIFFAVMIAVWGFVNIVLDFIFDDESAVIIPTDSATPQQQVP
jgi:hypothetical protein